MGIYGIFKNMLKKEAKKIVHGLTRTSKMPGYSYSLPAWECQTGSKLAQIPGTPCHGCYAMKGNYTRYPAIKAAQYKRLNSITSELWIQAMTVLVKGHKVFRWHDAGDLQSSDHLKKIFQVCENTPETKHWLPTQERKYLPLPGSSVPKNLVIRLSGSKVDGPAPKAWTHTSTVVTDGSATCPAPKQGGKCLSCRACWNPDIKNISYGKH
jgi:hypothetical protein